MKSAATPEVHARNGRSLGLTVRQKWAEAHHATDELRNDISVGVVLGAIAIALLTRFITGRIAKRLAPSIRLVHRSSRVPEGLSSDMTETSSQTTGDAEAESEAVARARTEVAQRVGAVAAAMEEMSASVREIADSSVHAAELVHEAVGGAGDANRQVKRLGTSSPEVGLLIDVISSIAEQTDLLALNETVDAGMAREAGREFAVVANEVKELAKQTAEAAEERTSIAGSIQPDSESSVLAIGSVVRAIETIAELQLTIASAVEDQSATTNEAVGTVANASGSTTSVDDAIMLAADATRRTGEAAGRIAAASADLNDVAVRLRMVIEGTSTSG